MTRPRLRTLAAALLLNLAVGLGLAASAQGSVTIGTSAAANGNLRVSLTSSTETATGPLTVQITYNGGGQSTIGDTWTATLSSDTQMTFSGTVTIDSTTVSTPGCTTLCAVSHTTSTGKNYLPDGAYQIVVRVPTAGGTVSSNTSTVTLDGATRAPTISAPLAGGFGGATAVSVSFSLGELGKAGSTSMTWTPTGLCAAQATVTVNLSTVAPAPLTVSVPYATPASTTNATSASGAFVGGCTYNLTLSYQDSKSHPANSTTVVGVTVPTTPGTPTITSVTPGDGSATVTYAAGSLYGQAVDFGEIVVIEGAMTFVTGSSIVPREIWPLTNGSPYTFKVRLHTALGWSGWSSVSAAVTPVGAPAAPGSPGAGASAPGEVTVHWTEPLGNGAPVTQYVVSATPGGHTCTANAPATSCAVTGLTAGQAYSFGIVANNGSHDSAAATVSATAPTKPAPPSAVEATRAAAAALVSWVNPSDNGGLPVTGLEVTASPGGATCAADPSSTTCVVHGLTDGVEYTFTVRAANAVGQSDRSDPSNAVTPGDVPSAPGGVSAAALSGQVRASWDAADGHGYAVTSYMATASPGGGTCTAAPPATSCEISGLQNGVAYTVSVVATNELGTSAASASSAAVTPVASVLAPTPGRSRVLTVKAGRSVTAGAILSATPALSGVRRVKLVVKPKSKRVCRVVSGKVKGLKPGVCSVSVSGSGKSATVAIRVTR